MSVRLRICTRNSLIALLSLFSILSQSARAERLPLQAYTVADGLAHNEIKKIVRDSRDFLWLCTAEGLARFDGYAFTNYTTDHGLPHPRVTTFLETRGGELWVGTSAGLVRFNPKGEPLNRVVYANEAPPGPTPMFTVVAPEDEDQNAQSVTALLEGRDGALWVGTLKGLYRLGRDAGRFELRPIDLKMSGEGPEQHYVLDLLEDGYGSLWIASASGLYRRSTDGASARYTRRDGLPGDHFQDLLADQAGQLWAGTRDGGFFRFVAADAHAPPVVAESYIFDTTNGEKVNWVYQLFETSDRRFWVATNFGVFEFFHDGDRHGRRFRAYTTRNGLLYHEITALNEDPAGNLWMGSYAGAMKLTRDGFLTYDEQDGMSSVNAIFGDSEGGVCFRGFVLGDERASFFDGAKLDYLHPRDFYHFRYGRFDGQNFRWFVPAVPKSKNFGWVGEGVTLQSRRNGEWWLGTGEGLYRFPPANDFTRIETARPLAIYPTKEGQNGYQQVFRIFEDSRGDIWASTIAFANGLARWDRASDTFQRDLADSPGLPQPADDLARSFGEDRAGNVWIGFSTGLARYREGRFEFFAHKDGLPPGGIESIMSDQRGRLWLASARSGLLRVDDPEAKRPAFTAYTTAEGLSSNSAGVITEDLGGNIYVATGRGLDRLDPETNRIKHFTTADGLAAGKIQAAYRDPQGTLWFGTRKGLSRFVPGKDVAAQPPPVLITNLHVSGARQPISSLGETEVVLPDLLADQNQLRIDFVGLGFAPGEVLRYQYRLEGAGGDWSAPLEQRVVNFERLAPGRYRFFVRAINSDGITSPVPAMITFTIFRPVWQRWWFLSIATLGVGLFFYSLYRHRVSRLLELARVRARIATDLHDDIGAGLSLIAVLSEVVRHEAGAPSPMTERLSVIAGTSRELVDSMSDTVWLINPARDHLRDLTQRMRRFASDVFTGSGIEFTFRAPADERHLKVGADVRRHVFLIFKESVNNVVRHSGCAEARIELRVEGGSFVLTVADDGRGFDAARAGEGNGLANMRERARKMGARLQVESCGGRGTTVVLRVPLNATVKERNGRLHGLKP